MHRSRCVIYLLILNLDPNLESSAGILNFKGGINSASLCSLAGQYDNPISTRLLAPINCSKILVPIPRNRFLITCRLSL